MPQSNFKYDRDTLFKEFEVAKLADIKLSKKKSLKEKENDKHDNRIQFCKDHIKLKSTNPEVYDFVDVNFENLLLAYQSSNPRDHFYMKVFGKTYAEKMYESKEKDIESVNN